MNPLSPSTAAPKKNSFLAGGDIHCFGNELAAGWGRALEDQKVMSRGRGATSFEFTAHGESAMAGVAAEFGFVRLGRCCLGDCQVRAGLFRGARPGEGRCEDLEQPLQSV